MQGINPLTMKCTYETPCGWCAKWDKKCDKKIPERGLRAKSNMYFGASEALMDRHQSCPLEEVDDDE